MPRLVYQGPKFRKHASGQAVVTINGRDYYLGPHRSKRARAEYNRLVAEYLTHGRVACADTDDTTVNDVLLAFVKWGEKYYAGSGQLDNVKAALRPLKALYGDSPAAKFGPLALKTVRERMIGDGLSRKGINARITRIKRVFRWATENELIPPSVFHGLQAVRGLSCGRTEAPETEPVRPVPDAFVDAVQGHVLPQVWAMIELQRLTGMRPGEVCIMRTCDIDTSGNVWVYSPASHKNAHRGHDRKIYLGPRAQAVLRNWLRTKLDDYLFQPKEAMEAHHAARAENRKTPLSCGNRPGTNRKKKPRRQPSDHYDTRAYAHAIRHGCEAAAVPTWSPNRLRHNAGTWLRREFGLDVARVILGHRSPAVTEIYAEVDEEKAIQVMAKVG